MMTKNKNPLFVSIRVGLKSPSLQITIYHHSASLVMPNGDPLDGLFYPTLALMMNSYILNAECAFIQEYGLIKLNAIKKILG